jgi:2,3-bisphosphoglycerate-dependent phosphoglycerate mutase
MAAVVGELWPPERIFSSPLKRAALTQILSKATGIVHESDPDLMEFNNGIQAAVPFGEDGHIPKPSQLQPHEQMPEGESPPEFRNRIESVFSKIVHSCSSHHDRIAIVTHGGVINMILHSFLHQPAALTYFFHTDDTGTHRLEVTDKCRQIL